MATLNQIESDLRSGIIEADFNEKEKLQALIMSDGLEHIGRVIDIEGKIVYTEFFCVEKIEPPTCRELINSYLSNRDNS